MADPVLHVIAGPNGAGKSTFHDAVLGPVMHLPFVNADRIAARHWPGEEMAHAYEASRMAAETRTQFLADRRSFATETVFSHGSKLDLVSEAADAGYLVTLHAVMVPENLAVSRVAVRRELGGHDVPEEKVRARYHRLWALVAAAVALVDVARFYDNSRAGSPFDPVARFERGVALGRATWPPWAPDALVQF